MHEGATLVFTRHVFGLSVLHLPLLHRLVQLAVREGRATSRDLEHIILLHLEGGGGGGGGDPIVADHWFR